MELRCQGKAFFEDISLLDKLELQVAVIRLEILAIFVFLEWQVVINE